jgi:hypothetical protein
VRTELTWGIMREPRPLPEAGFAMTQTRRTDYLEEREYPPA